MNHSIRSLYVVHHSHADIGYTDLQERVVQAQVDYIRSALRLLADPQNEAFRWNCETWFCAEQFLQQAAPAEREAFFAQMRAGRLGFSANYLNFCDLADSAVLGRRLDEVCALLNANSITPKTAMCADINGLSMGQRDALLDAYTSFREMELTDGERDMTAAEKARVKAECDALMERCEKEAAICSY